LKYLRGKANRIFIDKPTVLDYLFRLKFYSEPNLDGRTIREDNRMNRKVFLTGFGFLVLLLAFVVSAFAEESKHVLSIEAYDMLNTVPDTYLIDIRTRAEYQLVGHPINAYLFPYTFWTTHLKKEKEDDQYKYGMNKKNRAFLKEIGKVFKKTDNLLILSRDGTRSALAAKELLNAGFKKIYEVEDGFEGSEFPVFKDDHKNKFYRQLAKRNKIYSFNHRRHYGWQWWGLPWTYAIDPKFAYPPDLAPSKRK